MGPPTRPTESHRNIHYLILLYNNIYIYNNTSSIEVVRQIAPKFGSEYFLTFDYKQILNYKILIFLINKYIYFRILLLLYMNRDDVEMTFKLFKKQIVEETEHNTVDYIPKDCPIEKVVPKNNNYFNGIVMNTVFNTVECVNISGFMNGVLFNVTFNNCNLRRVCFMNAYLINCTFNECNISNTDFMNCHMINTKFNQCWGCADCMNVITLDTRLPYIVDRMNHKHFVTYLDYVDHIYCHCRHGGRNYSTYKIQKYENIVGLKLLVDTHTRYY